ncbi:MAG TPA: hypothetical protein VK824_11765, partial [Planctomycetota bacterium]|nr:hypothetical protein [Planctomycetota bacterium]
MQIIDCSCCGSALALPEGLQEGGAFACSRCGMALRNVAAARDFRWEAQDHSLRKHGATRGNLWGGLVGSLMWLVVLAVLMLLRGRFALGLFVAIAAPYLLLLAGLRVSRPRRPAVLWLMGLWMGLGAYCLYLAGVRALSGAWDDVMKGVADVSPALLIGLGCAWLVTGLL